MHDRRTIRVTGKGNLKIEPDTMRVTIKLTDTDPDYWQTLQKSTDYTKALSKIVEEQGFDRKNLKTLSFSVDTKYESYNDNYGNYKLKLRTR